MKKIGKFLAFTVLLSTINNFPVSILAQSEPLMIVYPPDNHQTKADSIFFIGSAPPSGSVSVDGKPVERSRAGYFAPSFPLKLGENHFTIRYGDREITRRIIRLPLQPELPQGLGFAPNSLMPAGNVARLAEEPICFQAIATAGASVSVSLGNQGAIALYPSSPAAELLSNSAVLIAENPAELTATRNQGQKFQGCTTIDRPGTVGNPVFHLRLNGQSLSQAAPGSIEILEPDRLEVIEVIAENGVARTGPSTDYSRLTPLPKGTRASVTGKEGEWLRLDYGGWIKASETRLLPDRAPPLSLIRSVSTRPVAQGVEIVFPLQNPVPVKVKQREQLFILTLHNTVAQTDTIRLGDRHLIKSLDWEQVNPTEVEYTFTLKHPRQWGYDLRYQGNNLILTLRYPPQRGNQSGRPLAGISILLDPGHGGEELGSVGPNGHPEKEFNLAVSKLLQRELSAQGAEVYLTRESDRFVSLEERVKLINQLKPTLAFSIHYNALPDGGNAAGTKGVSSFWYHPQSQDLAVFLHDYLVRELNRPSYGVFWHNLALTRPHSAPTVLLELGFTINPEEFEWIIDPQEQQQLAEAIANGIVAWLQPKGNYEL